MIPKADCCCNIGQSWDYEGSCEICPEVGSNEYLELCSNSGIQNPNVNECLLYPNLCGNGKCDNVNGGFKCDCNQGYTVDETGNQCEDVNECAISPGMCGNGECVNVPGGFKCNCDAGFAPSKITKVCIGKKL